MCRGLVLFAATLISKRITRLAFRVLLVSSDNYQRVSYICLLKQKVNYIFALIRLNEFGPTLVKAPLAYQ